MQNYNNYRGGYLPSPNFNYAEDNTMERPTCIPLVTQICSENEEYTLDFTNEESLKKTRTTLLLDANKVLEYCKHGNSNNDIIEEFVQDCIYSLQICLDEYEYDVLEHFTRKIMKCAEKYIDNELHPALNDDDSEIEEDSVFSITIHDFDDVVDVVYAFNAHLIACTSAFSLVSLNIATKLGGPNKIIDRDIYEIKDEIYTLNDYLNISPRLFEVVSNSNNIDIESLVSIMSGVASILHGCKVNSVQFSRFIGMLISLDTSVIARSVNNISKFTKDSDNNEKEESDCDCDSHECNESCSDELSSKELNFINSVNCIEHIDYLKTTRYLPKPENCVQGQEEIVDGFSIVARFRRGKLKVSIRATDLMAKILRYMYIISSDDSTFEYVNDEYDIPKYLNESRISELKQRITEYSNSGDMENILEYLTRLEGDQEKAYINNSGNLNFMSMYKYADKFKFKHIDTNCLDFLKNSVIIECRANKCDDDGIVNTDIPPLREFWIVDRDQLLYYISSKYGCTNYAEVKKIPFPEVLYTSPKSNFESILHYYLSKVSLIGLQTMLIQNDLKLMNIVWSMKHTAVLDNIREDIDHNKNLIKLFYTFYPIAFSSEDMAKYEPKQDEDSSDADKKEELIFSSESANTILDFDVELSDGGDPYMAVCRMYDMDSEKAYRDMCKYLGINYTFFGDGDAGDITEDMLNEKTSNIKDKVVLFIYDNDGNDKKLLRKHVISKTSLRKKLKAANPLDKKELVSLYNRNKSRIVTSSSVAYILEEAFMSNDDLRDKMKSMCLKH